mmetsp:Transcript_60089/g.140457  ORF Transcript_60089/g.140457 Transcript_60089/m.140457 type:complete len:208 (+) Transcript_60089:76-699(+)
MKALSALRTSAVLRPLCAACSAPVALAQRHFVYWPHPTSLRPPRSGETLESFFAPAAHKAASITWNLTHDEIMASNSMYPLESLWVHQGKLRCRLVAYAQGPYFQVRVRRSCQAGNVIEETELQAMLNLFGLTETPISTLVTEDSWFHKGLAVELDSLGSDVRVELRLRRFAALLRPDAGHFDAAGGSESDILDLVPAAFPPMPKLP